MPLSITLGQPCNYILDGHSATNGAAIPAGSVITITTTDATVAAAPAPITLAADQKEVVIPVSPLAAGSTDFAGTVQLPGNAGSLTIAPDTLTVAAAAPVLTSVTGTFAAG